MIRQKLILDIGWTVYVFYAATPFDVAEIISKLHETGCVGEDLKDAYLNISSGVLNNGITYSNKIKKESVMVFTVTSSPEEFQNSWDHEKGHLVMHICEAFNIDPYGEEKQYLSGEIGMKMFPVAKDFVCSCENK